MSNLHKLMRPILAYKARLVPRPLQRFVEDVFFGFAPLWLIKALSVENAGYLRYRTPMKGNIVVDAGAWKGHFSLIASRLVGAEGIVVAIEPQKEPMELLRRRFKRLRIQNVRVVHCGLFDRHAETECVTVNKSSFSVFNAQGKSGFTREVVQLRTLDELQEELRLPRVDFLKMDIEGAEIEALHGLAGVLATSDAFLAIATYHVREGSQTAKRVEEHLGKLGYEAFTGHPRHLTTYAAKRWHAVQDRCPNPPGSGEAQTLR